MSQFEFEIVSVLKFLELAFGNRLSDDQMDAYVRSLGSVNMIRLQAAAEMIVRKNIYFPKVSEILGAMKLIPDRYLSHALMDDHRLKLKALKERFYRSREIDRSGFDALYQELRECGYWYKAEYVRELERRFEETLKREEKEQGAKSNGTYKSADELRKLFPEFVK